VSSCHPTLGSLLPLFAPVATDFSGENAQTWYRNIDKLVHHVNANGTFNALYSTPSIYTSAKVASTPLPQRDEDVMPYFDDAHAVWSGYFSSSSSLGSLTRHLLPSSFPPCSHSPSPSLCLLRAGAEALRARLVARVYGRAPDAGGGAAARRHGLF